MSTLNLPAILDLRAVDGLRDALLARRGADVAIDAGEVERLGGLCLQVLLSARRTWAADGAALTFGAVSPAMTEQLALYGCADLIGNPVGVMG